MLYLEIAVCSDAGCNYEFQHVKIEADTIIDNGISFIKTENADINKSYQSNTIKISGINTEVGITISKGKIVKNGIELAGLSSSVVKGDKISVKLNSASSIGVTESMSVIIGGVTLTYSVTTGNDFNAGFPFISNGNYSGSNTTKYYYLTMPSAGSIDFTINGYSGSYVKVYDLAMNELDSIPISETVNLSAGSYILKIHVNDYSSSSVNVYSPVFAGPSSLTQLTNGNYSGSNTTKYYNLTMPSAGSIDFTINGYSGSYVKVYDLAMKELDSIPISETVNLSAGSYILKIHVNDYSSSSVNVYSPKL